MVGCKEFPMCMDSSDCMECGAALGTGNVWGGAERRHCVIVPRNDIVRHVDTGEQAWKEKEVACRS